jgi:hypothetical protein
MNSKFMLISISAWMLAKKLRHDTRHNDTWHNDTQRNNENATLCAIELIVVMLNVTFILLW